MQSAEQVVLEHGILRSDPARFLGTADSSYLSPKVGGPDSSASRGSLLCKAADG